VKCIRFVFDWCLPGLMCATCSKLGVILFLVKILAVAVVLGNYWRMDNNNYVYVRERVFGVLGDHCHKRGRTSNSPST
jgi:hypothetical protein